MIKNTKGLEIHLAKGGKLKSIVISKSNIPEKEFVEYFKNCIKELNQAVKQN